MKLKFTAFITLQKESLLPHVQVLQEADILLAEVRSLLESEGRKVSYGYLEGKSINVLTLKKERKDHSYQSTSQWTRWS